MGLPNINIAFQSTAASAVQRSEKGVVALILKDAKENGGHAYTNVTQVPSTLGAANQAYVQQAFLGYVNPPRKVLVYVLDQFLRLLHPFMPFITEEIWQAIPHEGNFLMLADWPKYDENLNFFIEAAHMESVMNAIRSIRNRRAEMNVPPSKKSTLYVVSDKGEIFRQGTGFICRLAYADQVIICDADPEGHENMVCVVTNDAKLYIPLEELIDFEKELARIEKEKANCIKQIAMFEGKLSNEAFVSRAPEKVVTEQREKLEKNRALLAQLEESEKRLRR